MTTTMWKAVALFLLLQNHLSSARHRDADLFDLTVLHMNDFHARFEETNDEGGTCKTEECIGGFSRLYDVINNALAQNPDSILLNGGDNFQGTLWYNIFKWNVTQTFLNELPFDAIVLGNHEFDDGIKGVVPFIKNLKAPVIVSNIDDSLEPDIQNTYQKSVVVERNGKKIGIIGVIIKTANEISSTENLKFFDESESVNAEAERLAKEENVFTNIVLSHSGYDVEQQIAKKATAASKIGLIVGGHSHTFLYTGEPVPGPATPAGPYPTIVERVDGKQVLVVQASCYCRYLGNITVSYDENGDCVDWSGTPYFLDTETPQDETINQEMQPWKDEIDAVGTKVIGKTLVKLDQTTCRYSECLLGNFVADAMVYGYTEQAEDDSSWTYASLAVYNTGGLRTTIEKGDITYNDMVTAQPFGNTFDVGEIEGQYIKEMFEVTMTPYSYGRAYADVNLLQISGFHVVGNLSQPAGSRIESLKVRCNECTVPIYEDLDLDKTYRLILPSFLKTGGDGFNVIAENLKNVKVGRVDIDVYLDYLEAKSPIFEEVEGRIQFVGETEILYRNIEN
jgi:5'-nucleotidase